MEKSKPVVEPQFHDFTKAKVGDMVWHLDYKWGIITGHVLTGGFPVIVYFPMVDITKWFDLDGHCPEGGHPVLFKEEMRLVQSLK